jgi:hypothetical protein
MLSLSTKKALLLIAETHPLEKNIVAIGTKHPKT